MKLITKTLDQSEFPFQLQQITQLPETLDVAGDLPGPENKFLCVIGSRNYDEYGRDACSQLISGLHGYPIVIVSGLAIGIDSLSHEAALKAGLKTVAFPGSGLSWGAMYPRSRQNLAKRILDAGGTLISPFKKEQEGAPWTFPVRNRLMAGISHAVLIIEARYGSGTLLTAGYATEFGRDILAVPGSIFSELSYGPHMLIRDGAAAISSSKDILRALDFSIEADSEKPYNNLAELSLSPEEKRIIAELQFSPLSSHDLIEKTLLEASLFNELISKLELLGVVREEGGLYRLRQ